MNENKKVFFIINKYSGGGFRPELEGRIITICGKLGIECTLEFTRERGHATELARQAVAEQYQLVFAVGGDGTVNEVARGLVNTTAAMGILPKGSGNGLARHLHIPMDIPRALELLGQHTIVGMDTVLINGNLSVNVSGIGFDGHVASLFGKNGKRGLLNYTRIVLSEFRAYRELKAKMEVDGNEMDKEAFILAFANSSQFGNNAQLAPSASVCDQKIDLCIIHKVPLSRAPGFTRRMFTGTIDQSPFVEITQAQRINVRFSAPAPYHIDGEPMPPSDRFDVQMQPASLRVIIPVGIKV